jgi:ERCC4-type nuclease
MSNSEPEVTIIQDTREQMPLSFKHKFIKGVKVEKLNVGDYGAEFGDGHRPPLVFERKSISDLYGTLTHGYERFRREIDRAANTATELTIIVEGSLTRTRLGTDYGSRTPESLIYQLFYIGAKYGVRTVFCNSPDEVSTYIEQVFIAHAKWHQNSK